MSDPTERVSLFFIVSLVAVAGLGAAGLLAPDVLASVANRATQGFSEVLGSFVLWATTGLLLLALGLAFSRYGRVVLGRPGVAPEFSLASWLAMLFAAGMGTGIMFWGVAEPVTHFALPPAGDSISPLAHRRAMVITSFHWGLHAWGIYAAAGLVLAYFGFRHGQPYLPGTPIRALFRGRRGQAIVAVLASVTDLVAVLAVVFGVAGSVAMGTFQMRAGLHTVIDFDLGSVGVAMGVLVTIVACYLASASTAIHRGIKRLSQINLIGAMVLMAMVLVLGPTGYLLETFATTIIEYALSMPVLSTRSDGVTHDRQWFHNWSVVLLLWWIAWAPFVGVFIARISRGRTIREFVVGVILVPTVFSMLWFSIFGGVGIFEDLFGAGGIGDVAINQSEELVLFSVLNRLPLAGVSTFLAIALVFIFLVTSADSASYVLGMLTSRGAADPPLAQKMLWGGALGILGGALILTDNVDKVKGIAVVGALPFLFVLLLQVAGFLRVLLGEQRSDTALSAVVGEHDADPPRPTNVVG